MVDVKSIQLHEFLNCMYLWNSIQISRQNMLYIQEFPMASPVILLLRVCITLLNPEVHIPPNIGAIREYPLFSHPSSP